MLNYKKNNTGVLGNIIIGILLFLLFIFGVTLFLIFPIKKESKIMVVSDQVDNKAKAIIEEKEVKQVKESSQVDEKEVKSIEVKPKIKVYLNSLGKVNEIYLEEYVKGVVASEMPAVFHEEALKAQAVAARTYALSHMKSLGGIPCIKALEKGADICDTTHCQVYVEKSKRMKKWEGIKAMEYWNKIEKAVNDTEGEVITYNGEVIDSPFYFATSSGKTENGEDVFAVARPYLKSVDSLGEEGAPKFRSNCNMSYDQFINVINNSTDQNITSESLKNSINIIKRSEGGSVVEIKIGDEIISGTEFRRMFSLNSANFNFRIENNTVYIESSGYGHGVGMSQWGANAMAKEGESYNKILNHYYQETEVTKVKYVD